MKRTLLLLALFLFSTVVSATENRIQENQTESFNRVAFVKESSSGDESGTSWSNAMDLDHALEAAANTESGISEIRVASGTYVPSEETFLIPEGIAMYGGYKAEFDGDDSRDLKSSYLEPRFDSQHIVVILGATPDVQTTLDGFTIQKANVYCDKDTPGGKTYTINGEDIYVSPRTGAGIYIQTRNGSQVVISNNDICKNVAGIKVQQSDQTLGSIVGAGVYAKGNVYFFKNNIKQNHLTALSVSYPFYSTAQGAGLYLEAKGDELIKLEKNRICENITLGSNCFAEGGGLYVNGNVDMLQNLIYNNGVSTVCGDEVGDGINNPFNAYGGGMYIANSAEPANVFILNNTLVGNNASALPGGKNAKGDAIYHNGKDIKIYNSIIEGAIHNESSASFMDAQNNIYKSTVFVDEENGDYRLDPRSSAINFGNNTLFANCETATDFEGNERVFGEIIDAGAYECVDESVPTPETMKILHVDASIDADNYHGYTWSAAIKSLDRAFEIARNSSYVEEIWVAEGTYIPSEYLSRLDSDGQLTISRDKTFFIPEGLLIYGGFPKPSSDAIGMDDRNPELYPSVLSGDLINNKDCYHVVVAIANEEDIVLDGFTITGGIADEMGSVKVGDVEIFRNFGAGVYAVSSEKAQVVLRNNTIEGNTVISEASSYAETVAEEDIRRVMDELGMDPDEWADATEEELIDYLTQITTSLIEAGVIAATDVVLHSHVLGKILGKGVTYLLDPVIDWFYSLILEDNASDIFAELLKLEISTSSSDGKGAGIYGKGTFVLENNQITNNKINTKSTAHAYNEGWTYGMDYLVATSYAVAQGAGVYIVGDLNLKANKIQENIIDAQAYTSNSIEDFKNITMSNSPNVIAEGAGLYVLGTVKSLEDVISSNQIISKTDNKNVKGSANDYFKGVEVIAEGSSVVLGGGASMNGDIDVSGSDFSNNEILVTAYCDQVGSSFSYGGGLMAAMSKDTDQIKIRNGVKANNNVIKAKEKENHDLEDDPEIYAQNTVMGGGLYLDATAKELASDDEFYLSLTNAEINSNKIYTTSGGYGAGAFITGNSQIMGNDISYNKSYVDKKADFRFDWQLNFISINPSESTLFNVIPHTYQLLVNESYNYFLYAMGTGLYGTGDSLQVDRNNLEYNSAEAKAYIDAHDWNLFSNGELSVINNGVGMTLFGDVSSLSKNNIVGNEGNASNELNIPGGGGKVKVFMSGGGVYWAGSADSEANKNNSYELNAIENTINSNVLDASIESNTAWNVYLNVYLNGGGLFGDGKINLNKNEISANKLLYTENNADGFDNCNQAAAKGGGVYLTSQKKGTLFQINNNLLEKNQIQLRVNGNDSDSNKSDVRAIGYGGGLSINGVEKTNISFFENSIHENSVDTKSSNDTKSGVDAGSYGGALSLDLKANSIAELSQNEYIRNITKTFTDDNDGSAKSQSFGGGLFISAENTKVTLNKETLKGNQVSAISDDELGDDEVFLYARGGGIYIEGDENTTIDFVNSLLAQSSLYAEVQESTGNITQGGGNHYLYAYGGAIYNANQGTTQILNSTLSDNKIDLSPYKDVDHNVYDVKVYRGAAGVYGDDNSGKFYIRNSILWNNQTKSENGTYVADDFRYDNDTADKGIWLSYSTLSNYLEEDKGEVSLVEVDYSDPQFVGTEDYTLQEGSPAINAGNASCYQTTDWGRYDLLGNPRIAQGIDKGAYEYEQHSILVWTGDVSSDWNDSRNWEPQYVPTENDKVYIPGERGTYPNLDSPYMNPAFCEDVYFMQGGQLYNQHYLTYERAYIQLNLGLQGPQSQILDDSKPENRLAFSAKRSTPLARDRWYMITSPLQEIVTGDLGFGGYPNTFLRKFSSEKNDDNPFSIGNWTNYYRTNAEPIAAGEGFVYHVRAYKDAPYYRESGNEGSMAYKQGGVDFGLAEVNGILELPFFEDEATSQAHRLHVYDSETQLSSFARIKQSGDLLPLTSNVDKVTRNLDKAYRLADYDIKVDIADVNDGNFVFLGNPFMAPIDFQKLRNEGDNASVLGTYYLIWTGNGFSGYSMDPNSETAFAYGESTKDLTASIAPLQAFLVPVKLDSQVNPQVTFFLESLQTNEKSVLRSSEIPVADKLDIVASNDAGSVLAFIALREGGSQTLGQWDGCKLLMGIEQLPEVYSLKESDNGLIAVGGNYINTNQAVVPIGLATKQSGNTTFTFSGMDNYNAQITFVDSELGKEFDITSQDGFEYNFDYTPPMKEGEVISNNSRFMLVFDTAKTITDIDEPSDNETNSVYLTCENGRITAATSAYNLITDCWVYNAQGALIYSNSDIDALTHSVDLSNLLGEVVIVRLQTANGVTNNKLLIK